MTKPELRKLCGQIASAKTRKLTFQIAKQLRDELAQRHKAGADSKALETWLQGLMRDALADEYDLPKVVL